MIILSTKNHFIFLVLFMFIISISSAQRVPGCLRYQLIQSTILRCVQCFPNLTLTSDHKCVKCEGSQYSFINGQCIKVANTGIVPQVVKQQTEVRLQKKSADESIEENIINSQFIPKISSSIQKNKVQTTVVQSKEQNSPQKGSFAPNFNLQQNNNVVKTQQGSKQSKEETKTHCLKIKQGQKCSICQIGYKKDEAQKCKEWTLDVTNNCEVFSFGSNQCIQCLQGFIKNQKGHCLTKDEIDQLKSQQQFVNTQKQSTENLFGNNNFESFGFSGKTFSNDAHNAQAFQTTDFGFSSQGKTDIAQQSSNANEAKEQNKNQIKHKYPQFPYCFDFEDGICWACIPGYVLNNIIKKCSKLKAGPSILDSFNPISENRDPNCNVYEPETRTCKECFRQHFFNKQTRLCTKVSPLCRTFDPQNGKCLSCYQNYENNEEGECIKI